MSADPLSSLCAATGTSRELIENAPAGAAGHDLHSICIPYLRDSENDLGEYWASFGFVRSEYWRRCLLVHWACKQYVNHSDTSQEEYVRRCASVFRVSEYMMAEEFPNNKLHVDGELLLVSTDSPLFTWHERRS